MRCDFDLCMVWSWYVTIVNHQWSIQSRSSSLNCLPIVIFCPQESRALLGCPHISIMGTARRRAIWFARKSGPRSWLRQREINRWLFLIIRGFSFTGFVWFCEVLWYLRTSSELYDMPPGDRMCWFSSRFETNSVTHTGYMIWIHCGWSYSVPAPTGVLQLLIVVAYLIYREGVVCGSSGKRWSIDGLWTSSRY